MASVQSNKGAISAFYFENVYFELIKLWKNQLSYIFTTVMCLECHKKTDKSDSVVFLTNFVVIFMTVRSNNTV